MFWPARTDGGGWSWPSTRPRGARACVGTARPLRDVKRLTRLLCDKIETIDPGFGIELMRLAVPLAEPLAPKQMISSLTEKSEVDVSHLIDTLANRVGEQRLYPPRSYKSRLCRRLCLRQITP